MPNQFDITSKTTLNGSALHCNHVLRTDWPCRQGTGCHYLSKKDRFHILCICMVLASVFCVITVICSNKQSALKSRLKTGGRKKRRS